MRPERTEKGRYLRVPDRLERRPFKGLRVLRVILPFGVIVVCRVFAMKKLASPLDLDPARLRFDGGGAADG